jgi:hypothetical protein
MESDCNRESHRSELCVPRAVQLLLTVAPTTPTVDFHENLRNTEAAYQLDFKIYKSECRF